MSDPLPAYSARDFYWACAGSLLIHIGVLIPERVAHITVESFTTGNRATLVATLGTVPALPVPPQSRVTEIGQLDGERLVPEKRKMVFAKTTVSTVALPSVTQQSASPRVSGQVIPADTPTEAATADVIRYRLGLARVLQNMAKTLQEGEGLQLSGRVVLSVESSAGGGAPRVSILQSSGRRALDDQAQEMIARAVQLAPVPESLSRRSFAIAVPVEFGLAE